MPWPNWVAYPSLWNRLEKPYVPEPELYADTPLGPMNSVVLNPKNMLWLYQKLLSKGIDPRTAKGAFQFIQDKNPLLRSVLSNFRLVEKGRIPGRKGIYIGSENTGAVYNSIRNAMSEGYWNPSPKDIANTTAHEIGHATRVQRGKIDSELLQRKRGDVGQKAYEKFIDFLSKNGL